MKDQSFFTTKRILWVCGVGFAGFLIGGVAAMTRGSVVGLLWGACIGYGFGSIFDQRQATKLLLVYWGVTLGLIGPFFGLIIGARPSYSLAEQVISGSLGAIVGMFLGLLFGTFHLNRLRRVVGHS